MLAVGVMRMLSAQACAPCGVAGPVGCIALRCLLGTIILVLSPNAVAQQLQIPHAHPTQALIPLPMGPTAPVRGLVNHSPNVQQLLKSEYRLEIEQRHSQLLITRSNVRRLAVTDCGICNYVQYSPTELAIVGLQLGTTDLMIWFDGEDVPAIYEVAVVRDQNLEEQRLSDFSRLERRLTELFPNSSVNLVAVGRQVLLKGQAYDSEEAIQILQIVRSEVQRALKRSGNGIQLVNGQCQCATPFDDDQSPDIINMLRVPGEFNIKLRVVIAEVSRSQLRELGVGRRHDSDAMMEGDSGKTLSGIFENGDINVLLNWLSANKSATVLAEPTIVCMSGHAASLLAGGEFAVPTTVGLSGGQSTSFRGVGTSMVVTPTVVDRDLIRLQIVPEFSEISGANSVNGIPGTTVKRVQTTVELREGQTLALGGLISRQTKTTVSRVPILGDIPFVGSRLFQSKKSSEDEVELLVLVTPEIVRPMEPDEVPPLPNFYITHPSDQEFYKYGQTEGAPDTSVYQTQPFGTGMNYGTPAGYSLQSASAVPRFSQPEDSSIASPSMEVTAPVRHFSGPPEPLQRASWGFAPQGYSSPQTLPTAKRDLSPALPQPSRIQLRPTPAAPVNTSATQPPVRLSEMSRINSASSRLPVSAEPRR